MEDAEVVEADVAAVLRVSEVGAAPVFPHEARVNIEKESKSDKSRLFIVVKPFGNMCWIFASIVSVRVGMVHGQKASLVSAMGATHEHGFMPEAVCCAECIALAGKKLFFAFGA